MNPLGIHLKHQVLFSLKNNEKIFMNVMIGAIRVISIRNKNFSQNYIYNVPATAEVPFSFIYLFS